jgi:hypothetical protein
MLLAFNSLVFTPPWEGGIHSILIRDPVPRRHWIAGQARNDKKWPPMQTFARKIRLVMRSAQRHKGGAQRAGDSRGAECITSLILPCSQCLAGFGMIEP